jgi:16S rRNA (uracil1498-N3)-methyltransferase
VRRAHVDPISLAAARPGERFALPDDAARRLARVLRLDDGAPIELFDGAGLLVRGAFAPPDGVRVEQVLRAEDALPPLILAQAVVATDKLELVVQKGTELGASAFWLFAADRSQVRLDGDRAEKRRARLGRIAEDAARQCGRGRVPQVEGPLSLRPLCERVTAFCATGHVAAVGAVDAVAPLSTVWRGPFGPNGTDERAPAAEPPRLSSHRGLLLVVGPEGGLTPDEIGALQAAGAQAVSLGPHVLRTETAGLVGLAAALVGLGRL